jgi:DNA-binding transcriptional LysR family regulator
MYAAKTGAWEDWNRIAGMGQIAHYCDNSLAYGLLVKAGNGIGLLGSYTVLEPTIMPLDLIKPISVRLYGYALTDRLRTRPVRAAFDWICTIFGNENPWFREEYRAENLPSKYDQGIKMLFNVS